jgi:hypothetical protein
LHDRFVAESAVVAAAVAVVAVVDEEEEGVVVVVAAAVGVVTRLPLGGCGHTHHMWCSSTQRVFHCTRCTRWHAVLSGACCIGAI